MPVSRMCVNWGWSDWIAVYVCTTTLITNKPKTINSLFLQNSELIRTKNLLIDLYPPFFHYKNKTKVDFFLCLKIKIINKRHLLTVFVLRDWVRFVCLLPCKNCHHFSFHFWLLVATTNRWENLLVYLYILKTSFS